MEMKKKKALEIQVEVVESEGIDFINFVSSVLDFQEDKNLEEKKYGDKQ
jgi:hypothetical protein